MLAWLFVIIGGLLALAVLFFALKWAFWPRRSVPSNRVRHQRIRVHLRLHPGRGHATLFELWLRWSRWSSWRESSQTRPELGRIHKWRNWTEHSVLIGRAQWFRRVWMTVQEHTILISLPGMGKTGWLADAICNYPGAVVCTSIKDDLYRLTSGIRRMFGPILMFNPEGFGGWLSSFAWNIIGGCEDITVATRRAESLCNAVSVDGMEDGSFWAGKATQMLQALFHAAALAGKDLRHVTAWVFGDDSEAKEILVKNGDVQMALSLDELHGALADKTADVFKMVLTRALAFMNVPKLAKSVLPGVGAGFDIRRFIRERGTLYLIATGDQKESLLAPLFATMINEIKYEGALYAMEQPPGFIRRLLRKLPKIVKLSRLSPPMGFFLDECTQIAPVPIDQWIPAVRGIGIQIFAVVHGIAQLRKRYGKDGAQIIMDTSAVKMVMPGVTDDDLLNEISTMCGPVYYDNSDKGNWNEHKLMDSGMIRQLPPEHALVVRAGLAPVIVKTPRLWDSLIYKAAKKRDRLIAPLTPPVPVIGLQSKPQPPEAIEGEAA